MDHVPWGTLVSASTTTKDTTASNAVGHLRGPGGSGQVDKFSKTVSQVFRSQSSCSLFITNDNIPVKIVNLDTSHTQVYQGV